MSEPVKRSPPLSVRLSKIERAALERRAGGVGLSTYIKSVLFGDDAKSPPTTRPMPAGPALLARILGQLGASGLALSMRHLSEAADTGSLYVDDLVTARLRNACDDIEGMRNLLMQALGKQPQAPRVQLAESFERAASFPEDAP